MQLETTLKGHFLNLYHMALCDAEIDTTELTMLYKIGEEKGVSRNEIDQVVLRPDTVKFSTPMSLLEKIESLYDIARIAWADGRVDDNEIRVMQLFCTKFGFEPENTPTIVQFLLDEAEKGTEKKQVFLIVSENL